MNDPAGGAERRRTSGASQVPPGGGPAQDERVSSPADLPSAGEHASFADYARQSPLAIAVTEGDAHLLRWTNPAFRELTGTADVLLHGQSIVEAIPDAEPDGLLAVLDQVYRTGAPQNDVHLEHPHATHGTVWRSYTVWPVRRDAGQPESLVIHVRDVTREHREHDQAQAMAEQMRAVNEHLLLASVREEERAAHAEVAAQRARFLADASAVLASSLDVQVTLQSLANLAVPFLADWCIVHLAADGGAPQRVAIAHADRHTEALAHELERSFPLEPIVDRVLERGEPVLIPTIAPLEPGISDAVRRTRRRTVTPKSGMAVPLTSQGRTIGVITLLISESDRYYGEAELALAEALAVHAALAISSSRLYEAEAVSQAKSRFLATVSHELRTPLTAILGYEELLADGISGPVTDRQRRQLGRIKQSATHLLDLIEEILTLSRIEAGREAVRYQPIDVDQLLDAVRTLVGPQAEAKGLTLTLHGPEHSLRLESDPAKARQILVNLVANAIKFTERGGVTLDTRVGDGVVAFVVRDTGIGIPPEHLDDIFEPFWQVEQQATRKTGGTGLGLSVSRRLARILGGDITVESGPGEGSTFTLTVPITAPGERGQ